MTSADFTLQRSDIVQPTLLDEDLTTTEWPMPPIKVWQPVPQRLTLKDRLQMAAARKVEGWRE